MKLIAPDYYNEFHCIASSCRHSCCIGWEIDIDKKTYDYYQSLNCPMGEKIRKNTDCSSGIAGFILDKDERCPFLDKNGLCEIITQLGEAALCSICTDHPRFRNHYSDRTEIGLGLCCEAAAELILCRKNSFSLESVEDDCESEALSEDESAFLKYRENLFAIASDRSFTVEERLENLLDFCSFDLPEKSNAQWAELFRTLERLDPVWDTKLDLLSGAHTSPIPEKLQLAFEQLLNYFLYRHSPLALSGDFDLISAIGFSVLSTRLIADILSCEEDKDIKTLCEICRLYSSEIEYSDENLNIILDLI